MQRECSIVVMGPLLMSLIALANWCRYILAIWNVATPRHISRAALKWLHSLQRLRELQENERHVRYLQQRDSGQSAQCYPHNAISG
jgi:hypothetical protein